MESQQSFEEIIEPFCKWRKEQENQEVLEIHLQGFKKDKLRVQINSAGVLTISGERDVEENRRIRFKKEVNVSKDCKQYEISARFAGGILYITMPKKIPSITTETSQPAKAEQQIQENEKPKQEEDKDKQSNMPDAAATAVASERISGLKRAVSWIKMGGKTALKLEALAAVVVVAAIGAYVAFKYRQAFLVEE